jgi:hypothetical protein
MLKKKKIHPSEDGLELFFSFPNPKGSLQKTW